MPTDLSQMSNEELMRIAGQGKQNDVSGLSNDELLKIAGIPQKPTFRTEVIAPFTHALSLSVFDIPKAIASRDTSEAGRLAYQEIYPEQQTFGGKALRFGLSVPAFVRGGVGTTMSLAGQGLRAGAKIGTRFIPEFLGKNTLGRMALRAGEFGAGQAAIAPTEGQNYAENVRNAALTGAMVPPAGLLTKGTGKNVVNAGVFATKTFGGITDATRATIRRLGADKVFEPIKAQADYIGKFLTPNVIQKVQSFDKDVTDALEKSFNVPRDVINNLKDAGVKSVDELRIKADDAYNQAFDKSKIAQISINQTYNKLGAILRKYGFIDLHGNSTARVETFRESPYKKLNDIYQDMKQGIVSQGKKIATGVVPKNDFILYRDQINRLYKDVPSDRDVYSLVNSLYNDAEKSGIAGIGNARSLQRQAFEAENSNLSKVMTDLTNPVKLDNILTSLGNPKNYNLREAYKNLIGKENFDNLEAHFANRDFNLVTDVPGTGGGTYASRAGLIKSAIAGGSKGYYKNIYPFTQKVKTGYETLRTGAEEAYQKPAFRSFISPTTQRYMKNRGGFADYGPFGDESPTWKPIAQPGANPQGKQDIVAGLTAAGTLMAGQAQAGEKQTIGQKNNNPINLKAFDKWYGMTGKDKDGHAIFKSLDLGIRAGLRNLKTHQRENPNQTLVQYLNKFAEKNGTKEATFVADRLGISTDARLKTLDMEKVIIPLAEFESKVKLTPADIKRVNNTSFPKKKFGKF